VRIIHLNYHFPTIFPSKFGLRIIQVCILYLTFYGSKKRICLTPANATQRLLFALCSNYLTFSYLLTDRYNTKPKRPTEMIGLQHTVHGMINENKPQVDRKQC